MSELERLRAIERVGVEQLEAYCRCATPAVARQVGLRWRRLGGAVQMRCDLVRVLNRNRTQGLGVDEPLDDARIEDALAFHRGGPAEFNLMVPPFALPADHEARLRARGLTWWKRRAVLARNASPVSAVRTTLRTREVVPSEWSRFTALGEFLYGPRPGAAEWSTAALEAGVFRGFLAWDGDEPVGAATMTVGPTGAWLGGAATHPEHRGRGAQSALLAARIQTARAAGATLLVLETLEPGAGEDDTSYRNAIRAGFELAFVRPSWVPDALELD